MHGASYAAQQLRKPYSISRGSPLPHTHISYKTHGFVTACWGSGRLKIGNLFTTECVLSGNNGSGRHICLVGITSGGCHILAKPTSRLRVLEKTTECLNAGDGHGLWLRA